MTGRAVDDVSCAGASFIRAQEHLYGLTRHAGASRSRTGPKGCVLSVPPGRRNDEALIEQSVLGNTSARETLP